MVWAHSWGVRTKNYTVLREKLVESDTFKKSKLEWEYINTISWFLRTKVLLKMRDRCRMISTGKIFIWGVEISSSATRKTSSIAVVFLKLQLFIA